MQKTGITPSYPPPPPPPPPPALPPIHLNAPQCSVSKCNQHTLECLGICPLCNTMID